MAATETRKTSDIAGLAARAARELLEAWPALRTAQRTERNVPISLALQAKEGSAARLVAACSDDPSLTNLRQGLITRHAGSGSPVQALAMPHLLIRSAIDGHCVASVVDEARHFAECKTSASESYTPLAGVTVTEAFGLGPNLDLVPWSDIPETDHKIVFAPEALFAVKPNSAIRHRSVENRVLFSSLENAGANMTSAKTNLIPSTQIDDFLRCVSVINVYPVVRLGSWMQFSDRIADALASTVYSCTPEFFDQSTFFISLEPVSLDTEATPHLFHLFEQFKAGEKDAIRLAIDRFRRALRRTDIVDKAIDLAIALEVMLLHDIQGRPELKFRSSIRGATFLGDKKAERLKIFEFLKKAYDLRSKAVHSGIIEQNVQNKQTLDDAISACAQIARKLIERRSFPNWDHEFVIGGQ